MANRLNAQEIATLKKMRLTDTFEPSALSIQMDLFLQDHRVFSQYLEGLKKEIGAPNNKVAASIFMKRCAFLAVLSLYAMTALNKRLNIDFENVAIVSSEQDGHWLPTFYLSELSYVEADPSNREQWRAETVRQVFADNLFPIMNRLNVETKISKFILWENIAVYIFWLYETVLGHDKDATVKAQASLDFQYLVSQAPGELFGRYQQNPLSRYYTVPIFIKMYDSEVRVRRTCCFSCELEKSPKRCKTCPPKCIQLMNGVEI